MSLFELKEQYSSYKDFKILNRTDYKNYGDYIVVDAADSKMIEIPAIVGDRVRNSSQTEIVIPESFIFTIKDTVCVPNQVILHNGFVLEDSFRRTNAKSTHSKLKTLDEQVFTVDVDVVPQEIIEQPCFYFDGECASHYGHFLLEVVSRLWGYDHIDFSKYLFITSAKTSQVHIDILAALNVKPEQIKYFDKPILCKELTILNPSYMLDAYFSDLGINLYERISKFYEVPTDIKKIYVSRSQFLAKRNLLNEKEVESIFQSKGYTVIYPEKLTFPEQVNYFRNAEDISGPNGTAMFNCIFSKYKGRRYILASKRFIVINDALVNLKTNSEILYIAGNEVDGSISPMFSDWTINLENLSNNIA